MGSNFDSRSRQAPGRRPLRWLLVLVTALLIGFVLYVNRVPEQAPEETVEAQTEVAPVRTPQRLPQPPAEDIPVRSADVDTPQPDSATDPVDTEQTEIEEALTLQSSDDAVRDSMAAMREIPALRDMLAADMLIQRAVGIIDGFSRGFIPTRILPLPGPSAPFLATMINGEPHLDAAGYARYDRVVRWLDGVDIKILAEAFHRFRPLLEQAYVELGYPEDELDNAVIRALDRMIDTPQLEGPVALRRDSVMYSFADPDLENRNALQKQLLRLGPDNLAKVQVMARDLRTQLLASGVD